MKLGELKQSLAKFPPDMNDMHVAIAYAVDGKTEVELVGFTGYVPTKGAECVVIGSVTEIKRRVQNGEMEPPPGYNDISDHI